MWETWNACLSKVGELKHTYLYTGRKFDIHVTGFVALPVLLS